MRSKDSYRGARRNEARKIAKLTGVKLRHVWSGYRIDGVTYNFPFRGY